MDCKLIKINGTTLTQEDINVYIENTVKRIFAILISYEECEKLGDFESYRTYLKRLIVEFDGIHELIGISKFLSLVGILKGIQKEDIDHNTVRGIVFDCISLLKSAYE